MMRIKQVNQDNLQEDIQEGRLSAEKLSYKFNPIMETSKAHRFQFESPKEH
jgi:hypothetical protein